MTTNPDSKNQGDDQHAEDPGLGWGDGCPVFDRLWGRANPASGRSLEDEVGGFADARCNCRHLEYRSPGVVRNHRLADSVPTPYTSTPINEESTELSSSSYSSKQQLFQIVGTAGFDCLATVPHHWDDATWDQTWSAPWASLESGGILAHVTNTAVGQEDMPNSHLVSAQSNTDEVLMVDYMKTPGCMGIELAAPPGEVVSLVDPGTSLEQTTIAKGPPSKKRLSCQHAGCKKTFPRNYERKRHTRLTHDKTEDFFCCVYGCKYASKPIGRSDKFGEHMRTRHNSIHMFICIFDDCRRCPFTLHEFQEHIQDEHAARTTQEDQLNVILKSLNLRRVPTTPGLTRLQSVKECPLGFLGCDFRIGHKEPSWLLRDHLRTHDLVERSRGYDAIKLVLGYWSWSGVAHCPICEERWDSTFPEGVISHIAAHTRESRSPHLKELYDMFQPYFLGTKGTSYYIRNKLAVIQMEIEEAGLMSAATIDGQRDAMA